MDANPQQYSEFGTGRNGDPIRSDGTVRPLTWREQQTRTSQALIRDVPLREAGDPRRDR